MPEIATKAHSNGQVERWSEDLQWRAPPERAVDILNGELVTRSVRAGQ